MSWAAAQHEHQRRRCYIVGSFVASQPVPKAVAAAKGRLYVSGRRIEVPRLLGTSRGDGKSLARVARIDAAQLSLP
jgi:hypothetical protein